MEIFRWTVRRADWTFQVLSRYRL